MAGPTGAAISNALCKALGQRIKILPSKEKKTPDQPPMVATSNKQLPGCLAHLEGSWIS